MNIGISLGEVADKVTILSIKMNRIKDTGKLENIRKQYDVLKKCMEDLGLKVTSEEFKKLEQINLKLWDHEDAIRLKEQQREFDEDFVQLARNIYFFNDDRAAIKRDINLKYGSQFIEEKEYIVYRS
jgi:hypothetical protein